ncbi:MAG: Holliday junction resolvase RecU [Bradymonadia bacterium]
MKSIKPEDLAGLLEQHGGGKHRRPSHQELADLGAPAPQGRRRAPRPPGGRRPAATGPENTPRRGGSTRGERRGKALEEALSSQHEAYQSQRVALIRKREGTFVQTNEGMRCTQAGLSDFEGVIAPGRAVRLEAKSVSPSAKKADGSLSEPSFRLANISEKQRTRFYEEMPFGSVCLLVISIEWPVARHTVFAVPFSAWDSWWCDASKPRSWKLEHLRAVGVECNGVDWLAAVRKSPHLFSWQGP